MGMGGYSNGSPSFYLDQRRRSQAAKQRAFDPRRQTMNLPQPGVATQQPGGVNEFGSPEAGSSGLAPHIAARAGLGAAGRGSQGGLLAANNAHRQLAGMLVGVEQQTPLIAHQPSVPARTGPAGSKPPGTFCVAPPEGAGTDDGRPHSTASTNGWPGRGAATAESPGRASHAGRDGQCAAGGSVRAAGSQPGLQGSGDGWTQDSASDVRRRAWTVDA